MKSKKKILLGLMATMLIMAIGTIAVYAASELKLSNSYTPIDVKVIWEDGEPENVEEVSALFKGKAKDTEFIYDTEAVVEKTVGWETLNYPPFALDTVAYELNEKGKPVFYPVDLKLDSLVRYDNGYMIDLEDLYLVTTKIEQTPRKRPVLIDHKFYDADGYDYSVEITLDEDFKEIEGYVEWKDIPEEERPFEVEVKVLKDGNEINSVMANGEGQWFYIIKIPENLEGYEVTVDIPGYNVKQEGDKLIISKPETKPEVKPEVKPETKPEVKPEAKPEAKPEEPVKENKVPKTADAADIAMWIMVAGIAVSGLALAKRKKENN